MKALINKINDLIDVIELGLLTKSEAFAKIKALRNELEDKYEIGSDKFIQCLHSLIDANEITKEL